VSKVKWPTVTLWRKTSHMGRSGSRGWPTSNKGSVRGEVEQETYVPLSEVREALLSAEAIQAGLRVGPFDPFNDTPVVRCVFEAGLDAALSSREQMSDADREFTHCPECSLPNGKNPDCTLCLEYRATAAEEHQAAEDENGFPSTDSEEG
jgi:hypothetical protein